MIFCKTCDKETEHEYFEGEEGESKMCTVCGTVKELREEEDGC